MRPNPAIQSRQAHRRRKALGRALHQVRGMRSAWFAKLQKRFSFGQPMPCVKFPKVLRKHHELLARVLMVQGA